MPTIDTIHTTSGRRDALKFSFSAFATHRLAPTLETQTLLPSSPAISWMTRTTILTQDDRRVAARLVGGALMTRRKPMPSGSACAGSGSRSR